MAGPSKKPPGGVMQEPAVCLAEWERTVSGVCRNI